MRVGYEGQSGSHSETACMNLFSTQSSFKSLQVTAVGMESFEKVFEGVLHGSLDFGLIPIENSLLGSFQKILDLLLSHQVSIVGEYQTTDSQTLLALPGTKLQHVNTIISHPYVIDQCRTFLSKLDVQLHQSWDTAASAQAIVKSNNVNMACIGNKRLAETYGLEILQNDIQDRPSVTRYILISKESMTVQRHQSPKISLAVQLRNVVGAFFKALSVFSLRNINVIHLESRPTQSVTLSHPWEYLLFIDIDGYMNDANVSNAIANLREYGTVSIFGCYPRYETMTTPVYGYGG